MTNFKTNTIFLYILNNKLVLCFYLNIFWDLYNILFF